MTDVLRPCPPALLATLADAEKRIQGMAAGLSSLDREPLDWEALAIRDAREMLSRRASEDTPDGDVGGDMEELLREIRKSWDHFASSSLATGSAYAEGAADAYGIVHTRLKALRAALQRTSRGDEGRDAVEGWGERLIEVLAYELYMATLVGNPAPRIKELGDRLRAPRPGDLVLETSTIWAKDRAGTRLGRLVRVVEEPMYTPEEWIEAGAEVGEPVPNERAWYLGLSDGREYRWTNASFIAVPTELLGSHPMNFRSEPPTAMRSPST